MNWTNFATHWKSTAKGLLTLVIVTCGVLLANPSTSSGKLGSAIALASALAASYIGIISKDAGVTEAIVPGIAVPQAVPSHEVPDNPAAKAVQGGNKSA